MLIENLGLIPRASQRRYVANFDGPAAAAYAAIDPAASTALQIERVPARPKAKAPKQAPPTNEIHKIR